MKCYNFLLAAVIVATIAPATVSAGSVRPKVSVNSNGRMTDTKTGKELRYYGTNYTLPFAHGYRATSSLGINRKHAIERDVYHLSRMGMNAFRLHLWDAELADSVGNLLNNEHLDLLDYLIAQLGKRGIDIILTAQTNFGNGYPERNIDTGAFTYDYEKCKIHEIPAAIEAQQRYIAQLAAHQNPYTGRSYLSDTGIIAMEINNEPCHTSSPEQVKDYINTMVKSLKSAGWEKPILYNVSHNGEMVSGYYGSDIQGTTYQWYPIGLVAGHERKGNFLPYVADYHIPFSNQKKFNRMAKVVYEFDPADMLDSYLYPAVARTCASNGFQWATQFAYDPIDLARFNTEYQTHYLNLAYTPQKALGMKIAKHVMEVTPYKPDAGAFNYPSDSVFGDVTLSYRRNLALLNSPAEFVYTNSTDARPVMPDSLRHIAGYGSSALVSYDGRGAYLIDRITGTDAWRIEVLPDVVYSGDPFAKPSLRRECAHIIEAEHPMSLRLPGLSAGFTVERIAPTTGQPTKSTDNSFTATPGVYVVASNSDELNDIAPDMQLGAIRLNEYVAPPVSEIPTHLNHSPAAFVAEGDSLMITAEAFAPVMPDSLILYPDHVSFWREHNSLYTMKRISPYIFAAVIPARDLRGRDEFRYRIVIPGQASEIDSRVRATSADLTFPGGIEGNPLDWDAADGAFYTIPISKSDSPIVLFDASKGMDGMEVSTIPDTWIRAAVMPEKHSPVGNDVLKVSVAPGEDSLRIVLTKYVWPSIIAASKYLNNKKLHIRMGGDVVAEPVTVSLVNRDGITFSANLKAAAGSVIALDPSDFAITPTLLVPAPYPTFLGREFIPEGYNRPLDIADVEKVQIVISGKASDERQTFTIGGIWLD